MKTWLTILYLKCSKYGGIYMYATMCKLLYSMINPWRYIYDIFIDAMVQLILEYPFTIVWVCSLFVWDFDNTKWALATIPLTVINRSISRVTSVTSVKRGKWRGLTLAVRFAKLRNSYYGAHIFFEVGFILVTVYISCHITDYHFCMILIIIYSYVILRMVKTLRKMQMCFSVSWLYFWGEHSSCNMSSECIEQSQGPDGPYFTSSALQITVKCKIM